MADVAIFACNAGDIHPWGASCIACGGAVDSDPEPGEQRGPFEAPEGSLAPGKYCSERCWEEWDDYLQKQKEARERMLALCPECGFDRQEHDEGCSRA